VQHLVEEDLQHAYPEDSHGRVAESIKQHQLVEFFYEEICDLKHLASQIVVDLVYHEPQLHQQLEVLHAEVSRDLLDILLQHLQVHGVKQLGGHAKQYSVARVGLGDKLVHGLVDGSMIGKNGALRFIGLLEVHGVGDHLVEVPIL
jgi:hypothetical protein